MNPALAKNPVGTFLEAGASENVAENLETTTEREAMAP
jgi:hypothetical protein